MHETSDQIVDKSNVDSMIFNLNVFVCRFLCNESIKLLCYWLKLTEEQASEEGKLREKMKLKRRQTVDRDSNVVLILLTLPTVFTRSRIMATTAKKLFQS